MQYLTISFNIEVIFENFQDTFYLWFTLCRIFRHNSKNKMGLLLRFINIRLRTEKSI